MIRRIIAMLSLLLAATLGVEASLGRQPTGWTWLDRARGVFHEQVDAWLQAGLQWWGGLDPTHRLVVVGGIMAGLIALLAGSVFRWFASGRRRTEKRLQSISVPYFVHEVGEAGDRFVPGAAVYPESERLRVTVEIVSADWDAEPELPVLLLRLVSPSSGRCYDYQQAGRPTTPDRFQATFDVDDLAAIRQEPGSWTLQLRACSQGQQSPVLASRTVRVFDAGSLLDDLRVTRFDVTSSSGNTPERNGLLLAGETEHLLVHAVVATTHADAARFPPLEACLVLSRPDGSEVTSSRLPLTFDGSSAVLSAVELHFPLVGGRRPASNWNVRLLLGGRVLADRTLGVATRAQLGELAEVVELRLLRVAGGEGVREDVGERLCCYGTNPQTLVPVARVRTPAPSARQPVNFTFVVMRDDAVLHVLEQQHALGRNDNWVVGGEWTLSVPRSGEDRYGIAICIDGKVRGERVVTVVHRDLRVTDAQGRLVGATDLPEDLDADADDVLSGATTVRL